MNSATNLFQSEYSPFNAWAEAVLGALFSYEQGAALDGLFLCEQQEAALDAPSPDAPSSYGQAEAEAAPGALFSYEQGAALDGRFLCEQQEAALDALSPDALSSYGQAEAEDFPSDEAVPLQRLRQTGTGDKKNS